MNTHGVQAYLRPEAQNINLSAIASKKGLSASSLYSARKIAVESLTRCFASKLDHTRRHDSQRRLRRSEPELDAR